LENVDVVNHRKRNQINVYTAAEPDWIQRTKGDTFSINQHESFFGQQTAQVELNGAVPAIGDVHVCGSPRLLRQKSLQIRCIAKSQFFDVRRAIRITGLGPVSSAVGMLEPVTMTRSTSATRADEGSVA